jgi:hypothetical protein
MDVSVPAQAEAGAYVRVMLTPAQAKDIACAIRTEIMCEFGHSLAAPVPRPENIARLRTTIDLYAEQLELLDWGEPSADIEIACPRDLFATIAQELQEGGEESVPERDVAVCAVLNSDFAHRPRRLS